MVALAGYEDFVQIHDSANSQVYRARRVDDGQPVVLKFLNRDYPTPEQIRRYKQEYYLTCQLEAPGIIKAYQLETWQRSYVIVLEDFGAMSLKQWLAKHEHLSLEEFLFLAIAITESLGQIHAHNIIHKDINPNNIVFNPETKELKIIDFGISTQLSQENLTLKNPNVLEGTLAYISPEQTGRMNRGLDYRSDFYSLGVTFYEMLTEKLPFDSVDPLELIHFHIAKEAPAGIFEGTENREQETGNWEKVPSVLAEIAIKLMAKNAEDRYQSAAGLKADLETCYRQFKATGKIASFPLGKQDISDRFHIPQKLYGREVEIAKLLAVFERVAETGNVELILVAGYSGIGKSSLVQELYKPITARRGYFIAGKFDQFQRNIPYSAIVAAFGGLIEQLLGESEAQLQHWREKLLQALGNNGQIMIDVIPAVELIIGPQPAVPVVGANEAQNRFNFVFGNFIRTFCTSDRPLTLFLDDLQWADLATLQLVERLLGEGQSQYLLLLGAYRDNEVSIGHPLTMALEKLQQNKQAIERITLTPLPPDQTARLIGDTLQQDPENIDDLTQLVWEKTAGNPFFLNEFLQALYDENLLQFHHQSRCWQWNMVAIQARNLTDNVVELMVGKLQKLPPSVQAILSLAACLGAEFDLELMTWIGQKSLSETFELLKIAINRGLIIPLSELDENLLIQSYKFGHDRIQQAAYALIPDVRKAMTHYRIGQLLLQKLSPEAREESIFELVGQLNYGTAFITDQTERDRLAQLNLLACRKARAATAYQAGCDYACVGLSLLGEAAWQRQYTLCLAFHNLAAELALLCGDFESMEQFIEAVIERGNSLLDKVNAYHTRILANVYQHNPTAAIAIAQHVLQQLGVVFPDDIDDITEDEIQQTAREVSQLIADRDIQSLIDLPMMENREKIAIIQIANSVFQATYIVGSPLFALLTVLTVKLSIQYGNLSLSASAYAFYGTVACSVVQDIEIGVKFGQLALEVVSKLAAKAVKPVICHVMGMFISHRISHIKTTIPLLQEAYVVGLEVGNLEYVGAAAEGLCISALWGGQSLPTFVQEAQTYCQNLVRLNQLTSANYCRIFWQATLNLLGLAEHCSILSGEAIEEEELLSHFLSAQDVNGLYHFYVNKLFLCYLLGEIEAAKNQTVEVRRYLKGGIGMFSMAGFYFYDSLVALAAKGVCEEASAEELERVKKNQAQLQQYWVHYAPMNHQHKIDLVNAEEARILGKRIEAIELYDQAISGAKANEYIHEEALANELAAKFYLDWGKEKIAASYMQEAHYCYVRWGATAKVKHLEDRYPQLLRLATPGTSNLSHGLSNSVAAQQTGDPQRDTSQSTRSNSNSNLDLATLMKASQAISREIVLSQLLTQLVEILLENTGAQSGFLILETEGKLRIEAETWADGKTMVLQSMPLEFVKPDGTLPLLSSAVVNYVARTQNSVVLSNAQHGDRFTREPYIQKFQVKSVLCVPLLNQGQLRGVVYLENNLTTGAFTQERVEIVQLLSGQAAIAISNAQLYRQLQDSEQQLKQFLDAVPVGVGIIDAKGHPYYTNRRAQEILGKGAIPTTKSEDITDVYRIYVAQTDRLYPPDRLPSIRALQGEVCRRDDLEIHRGDGIIPVESLGTPVYNERGEIVYAMTAFQDVTERKKAEKLLVDYNQSLEKQLALSLENSRLYDASKRFVPEQFLSFLEKESIADVKLGDQVEREMTVLFADIRDFTTLSERMTPAENFAFINEYLGYMEPQIQRYGGFIDKYIGDAIMALFPNAADDAVQGALAMLEALKTYNQTRQERNLQPLRIGIGLHTGRLMLGTVGGSGRMDGTAIGDAVNLSSRVEGLTKTYGISLLITHQTFIRLSAPFQYDFRFVGRVKAKGKTRAVSLLEVFSADPLDLRDAKNASKGLFEQGLVSLHQQAFAEAARLFLKCVEYHDCDRVARIYLERCHAFISD